VAKAWAADEACRAAVAATGRGVLVSLGGDLAVGGAAPAGGWLVRVTDDHRSDPADLGVPGQTIAISSGALATSSITVRRVDRDGAGLAHVVDPFTGRPVTPPWRTVSVAAPTCVAANIASTAAIVRGQDAPRQLERSALPARLVAGDGSVTRVCSWPEPER